MKALLVLVLTTLAVAYALTPPQLDSKRIREEHSEYLHKAYRQALGIHASVKARTFGNGQAVVLQSLVSDCYDALLSAEFFIQNCSLGESFWNETDLSLIQSQVLAYCDKKDASNSTCVEKVVLSVERFATECWAARILNDSEVDNLKQLLTFSYLPCIQNDGHWCYVEFQNTSSLWTDNITVTEGLLTQTCTACTFEFLEVLATYANPAFYYVLANFFTVCTRNDNNTRFCFLPYQAAVAEFSAKNATVLQQTTGLCDPCTQKVLWRQWSISNLLPANPQLTEELGLALAFSEYACQKNVDGQYCTPLIEAYNFSILTICETQLLNCPGSTCQTNLLKAKSDLGCCFGTWFDFLQFVYVYNHSAYPLPYPPQALENLMQTYCQVAITHDCAEQKIAALLYIANINHTWYLAHKAEIDQLINDTIIYIAAINVVKLETLAIEVWDGQTTLSSHGFKLQAAPLPGLSASYTLNNFASPEEASSTLGNLNTSQSTNSPSVKFSTSLNFNALADPTQGNTFSSSANLSSSSSSSSSTGTSSTGSTHSSGALPTSTLSFSAVVLVASSCWALL